MTSDEKNFLLSAKAEMEKANTASGKTKNLLLDMPKDVWIRRANIGGMIDLMKARISCAQDFNPCVMAWYRWHPTNQISVRLIECDESVVDEFISEFPSAARIDGIDGALLQMDKIKEEVLERLPAYPLPRN